MINDIKSLINDLGVNLAGVQIVMEMNNEIKKMKAKIEYLESNLEKALQENNILQGNTPE
jgi:hypothetical protein